MFYIFLYKYAYIYCLAIYHYYTFHRAQRITWRHWWMCRYMPITRRPNSIHILYIYLSLTLALLLYISLYIWNWAVEIVFIRGICWANTTGGNKIIDPIFLRILQSLQQRTEFHWDFTLIFIRCGVSIFIEQTHEECSLMNGKKRADISTHYTKYKCCAVMLRKLFCTIFFAYLFRNTHSERKNTANL